MSLLLTRSGYTSGLISRVIDNSFDSLGFNPDYSGAYGAWLVRKRPLLDGTVFDEVRFRKDRQELSARATSFAINKYFNGDVDIAGWTEFSISCWIRHGEVAARMFAMGSYAFPAANYTFNFGVLDVDDTPRLKFYNNAGDSDAEIIFPANSTNDNSWHLLAATYDFATETMTGYIDGRDVTAASTVIAGTNGSINTTQDPNDFTIGTLLSAPTSYDWNGQLQLPMIYEGIWTPSEVRDLYLQNYENVTSPTYAWFLDGENAYNIAGSSSVAAVNGPTRYEDQECPDWLNMQGWNFGNQGRFKNLLTTGDEVTFKIKADPAESRFVFLSGDTSAKYAVVWQQGLASNGLIDALAITIDGVRYTVIDAGDLYTSLADGVEHTVMIELNTVTDWTYFEWGSYDFSSFWLLDEVGYIRPTHINGEPITADDIDFDNTTVLAPKVFSVNQDTDGYSGDDNSFGDCKRNWQLRGGPAINLDGVNQRGVITNTDDFSASDWTLSGYINFDALGATALDIASQATGTGVQGRTWLRKDSSDSWQTAIGGIVNFSNSLAASKSYYFELEKSSTTLTLRTTNLTDGLAEESDSVTATMETADGHFYIGSNSTGTGNFLDGKIWGLKLDHANGFNCPISEQTGTTSYDISGNQKNIEWQIDPDSPDWDSSANDSYFWSEAKGYDVVGTFDGVDDYVAIGTVGSPVESTISFWFNKSTTGSDRILHYGRTLFQINGSGQLIYFRDTSQSSTTFNMAAWTTNEWVHLMLTHVGDDVNVYIDNVLQGTALGFGAINTSSNASYIGSYQGGSFFFNGLVRDVRNYSRELTADERAFIYTNRASGTDPTLTDCVFKYDMGDSSGLTVADSSGNGSDGTINGATSAEFWGGPIIPAKADGTSLIRATPSNPSGPYHNDSQALLEEFPVTNSDSQGDVFYTAAFVATPDANINADTNITGFPFSIECDVKLASTSGTDYFVFASPNAAQYFGLQKVSGANIRVLRRGGGIGPNTISTIFGVVVDQWHETKVIFHSATSFTVTFDGVSETFTDELSVPFALDAVDGDLWIGQFRESLGENPEFEIKNVVVKQGDTIVNDMPLYKDALDRSDNNFHGTVTNAVFRYESRELDLNPEIAQTNTRTVITGDRSIVRIGPKATFAGNDSQILYEDGNVVTENLIPISEV